MISYPRSPSSRRIHRVKRHLKTVGGATGHPATGSQICYPHPHAAPRLTIAPHIDSKLQLDIAHVKTQLVILG